jgi:endoglucanase
MQVRHIEKSSGKVYIDSDSFLPIALLGNQVTIFSEKPDDLGSFIKVNGTVEALGAIHFGDAAHRNGTKGVGPDQLYVDLGCYGAGAAERVAKLGIKPGDAVLMDSPLRRALGDDVFQGAYLDNGVGSFVVTDLARVLAEEDDYIKALENIRVLFAVAAHEEIGRFGSRVLANKFSPDVLVAIDVNHDYVNAPGVGGKRFTPLEMGKGYTISVGSVASRKLNEMMQKASKRKDIPVQLDCVGRDTGTDAMAGVLGSVDCAVGSIGVPTRNMHTSSEAASTRDLDACLYGLAETILMMSEQKTTREDFLHSHVDLSKATLVQSLPPLDKKSKKDKEESKADEE